MAERAFPVSPQQWERFLQIIGPTLGELLTASLLSEAADEATLFGGLMPEDVRCRLGDRDFTVEVKSAWWQGHGCVTVGHSPIRESQQADLVALFQKFSTDADSETLRRIEPGHLTVEDDRFFYLVPFDVMRALSRYDGKSQRRALAPADKLQPFAVSLADGISREGLERLLSL